MKKMKKLFVVAMVFVLLVQNNIFVKAFGENVALQETINKLVNGYSEHYNIYDTSVVLCSSHEVGENVEKLYMLEMQVELKADSVKELPYYQGIEKYCTEMAASLNGVKATAAQLRNVKLSAERTEIYNQLENYIGQIQTLTFYILEEYNINIPNDRTILFENGEEYVSWEEMLPLNAEKSVENGYAIMSEIDMGYEAQLESKITTAGTTSYSYVTSEAVAYMVRYTSNPTSCNACNDSNCGMYVDITKYNSNYAQYATSPNDHADCANYVSQALSEGGIPEDGTWYPGSVAWINVNSLTTYMTSNGYWTRASYNTVQKGDIIKFGGMSHVGMITEFDGATYRYSAHTNDRKNVTITINSTTSNIFYRAG